jgi:hypothetical protein
VPDLPRTSAGGPNRRDVLKSLLFGSVVGSTSRREALTSLAFGTGAATQRGDSAPDEEPTASVRGRSNGPSPIPTRATRNVSVRAIADATNGVSAPDYDLSEVARERGLLGVTAPTKPRADPPFALRELITSQKITDKSNKTGQNDPSWRNWVRDHLSKNVTEFEPGSKRDLIENIVWNVRQDKRIRAVGSGHSHSNVAEPDTGYIDATALNDLLDTDWSDAPGSFENDEHIVRVQAGATIKYLNRKLLKDNGYGLANMGSFDGQTLAGAVNTGTHGTGAGLGSLADNVQSVELVTVMESPAQPNKPIVRAFRIEPTDGITNRRQFEADVGQHETTLIQDDDVFHAVVVGYGCMGVVYSYTMKVRDRYFLYEDAETVLWDSFKNDIDDLIAEGDDTKHYEDATGARHFQFRVNLAQLDARDNDPADRNPRCLKLSHREPHAYYNRGKKYPRWQSKPNQWGVTWPPERVQKSVQQFLRQRMNWFKGGTGLPYWKILDFVPVSVNARFQSNQNSDSFESDGGSFTRPIRPAGDRTASYIALRRLPEDNPTPTADPTPPPMAISTEIAVPADQVVTAVEGVFDEVVESNFAYSAPMGVRFVARSEHALTSDYRGKNDRQVPVAKIEVPYPVGAYKIPVGGIVTGDWVSQPDMLQKGKEALGEIEQRLYDMADDGDIDFARPHMGKTNTLERADLKAFYEEFETWESVHAEFNAFGTYNNGFTREKGLSQ